MSASKPSEQKAPTHLSDSESEQSDSFLNDTPQIQSKPVTPEPPKQKANPKASAGQNQLNEESKKDLSDSSDSESETQDPQTLTQRVSKSQVADKDTVVEPPKPDESETGVEKKKVTKKRDSIKKTESASSDPGTPKKKANAAKESTQRKRRRSELDGLNDSVIFSLDFDADSHKRDHNIGPDDVYEQHIKAKTKGPKKRKTQRVYVASNAARKSRKKQRVNVASKTLRQSSKKKHTGARKPRKSNQWWIRKDYLNFHQQLMFITPTACI